MTQDAARPWWPKGEGDVKNAVRRLRDTGGDGLFTFLLIAAAGGQWKVFKKALETAAALQPRGVEALLDNIDANAGWSHVYSVLKFPPALFAFFIKVVKIAWTIKSESPTVAASPQLRALVLKKAESALGPGAAVPGAKLKAELLR